MSTKHPIKKEKPKEETTSVLHDTNFMQFMTHDYISFGNNSYTDAFQAAAKVQSTNVHHMVDSNIEGILLGIMENETLQYHIMSLPNNKFIQVPFKDREYEFYVKIPEKFGRFSYYKIRAYTYERLITNDNGQKDVGVASSIVMEAIDSVEEIPSSEMFSFSVTEKINFKITNQRQSLKDDTYRIFLNDIEVVALFNDQENAYISEDFTDVFPLLNDNGNKVDKFSKEIAKQNAKISRKFNGAWDLAPVIYNGKCLFDGKDNNGNVILTAQDEVGNCISITIHDGADLPDFVIAPFESIAVQLHEFENQNIKLQKALSMDKKTLYYILIIGGEIVAAKSSNASHVYF